METKRLFKTIEEFDSYNRNFYTTLVEGLEMSEEVYDKLKNYIDGVMLNIISGEKNAIQQHTLLIEDKKYFINIINTQSLVILREDLKFGIYVSIKTGYVKTLPICEETLYESSNYTYLKSLNYNSNLIYLLMKGISYNNNLYTTSIINNDGILYNSTTDVVKFKNNNTDFYVARVFIDQYDCNTNSAKSVSNNIFLIRPKENSEILHEVEKARIKYIPC